MIVRIFCLLVIILFFALTVAANSYAQVPFSDIALEASLVPFACSPFLCLGVVVLGCKEEERGYNKQV